jgi:hypothetical protein
MSGFTPGVRFSSMRHLSAINARVVPTLLVTLFIACEQGPTRPSNLPAVPLSGVVRLEIVGPSTLAPGEQARYTVRGINADGTSRDLSADATWRAVNGAVLNANPDGSVSGGVPGETSLNVSVNTRGATKLVIVTPSGTFRVKGVIAEAGAGTRLGGAEITLTSAVGEVLRTQSTTDGVFQVFGVPPDADLRISRSGYQVYRQRLDLKEHTLLDVQMALLDPRPDVSGTYVMSIGSPECPPSSTARPLPEELWQRRYEAAVTQSGATVSVTLAGARFASNAARTLNRFGGTVVGGRLFLRLQGLGSPGYYYYAPQPEVAERLDDDTYLIISGVAELAVTDRALRGTLAGAIYRRAGVFLSEPVLQVCSGQFPMVLSR